VVKKVQKEKEKQKEGKQKEEKQKEEKQKEEESLRNVFLYFNIILYYIMAYFGFHGRYKPHKYEDCKDFKTKRWEEILETEPKDIPLNILTNSCNLKKVGEPGYINFIQLDAIKQLLEIKKQTRTKDISNYEEVKNRIIKLFKKKYSSIFCKEPEIVDNTSMNKLFSTLQNYPSQTIVNSHSTLKPSSSNMVDIEFNKTTEYLNQKAKSLFNKTSSHLKRGGKRKRRKTRRRKSKKYSSLF